MGPEAMQAATTSLLPDGLVFTIGHSNRNIEDFIDLLRTNEVAEVIDVRTIPRSRHNSQFNLRSFARVEGLDVTYPATGTTPIEDGA